MAKLYDDSASRIAAEHCYSSPGARNRPIRLPLTSAWAVATFVALVLLCAGVLMIAAVRIAGSQALAASMKGANLRRAMWLWPANPEVYYRLGMLGQNSTDARDSAETVAQLRRATELGPMWARYWGLLGWACESAGDTHCADEAMLRIRKLAPMDTEAVSLVANYYLVSDRPALALEQFRHLLRIDPSRDKDVFRICQSAGYPEPQLREQFIEAGADVALDYFSYLVQHGRMDSARALWTALVERAGKHQFTFTAVAVARLADTLLALGLGEDAQTVRLDMAKLKVFDELQVADGNLVFNGDFEHRPSNDGFDWRRSESPYPIVDFAAGSAYSGKGCLRANFTVGTNEEYLLAYQFLPLEPNSRYRLSAYVRSDSITSDSGPRLRISDPACPECLNAMSHTTVGTTPWHEISVDLSTGPKTRLGRLELFRPAGRFFPKDITGTFWLDHITLKLAPAAFQAESEPTH